MSVIADMSLQVEISKTPSIQAVLGRPFSRQPEVQVFAEDGKRLAGRFVNTLECSSLPLPIPGVLLQE